MKLDLNNLPRLRHKKWLFLPPVLLGLIILAVVAFARTRPQPTPEEEVSRVLRVIEVRKVKFVPRVFGYGTAEPGKVWQAVAQVKGRVISINSGLSSGMPVKEGTELLKIDPVEYELAVARLEAEIEQTNAQLAEQKVREDNYRAALEIEEKSLALAEKELARQKRLLSQKAIAAASVEATERDVLQQRQSVQNQKNALNLIPVERKTLQATLNVKNAGLKDANLDLENTSIKAPFNSRLGEVNLETGQFVSYGQVLFEVHGTDATEVEVQLPVEKLSILLNLDQEARANLIAAIAAMELEKIRSMLNIKAIVRLQSGQLEATWDGEGETTREFVDPQTRMIGVVIRVDEPYKKIIPGKRPPLVKGMFCEVEMRGEVQEDKIVIPRTALHNGHVYLVGKNKRLRRRAVEPEYGQGGMMVIKSGLRGGEQLIVSDPTPAIDGQLVKPETDQELQSRLIAAAAGKGDLE